MQSLDDRSLINNYRELESVHHRRGSQPTSMSTYLIFNQLRIIHPQFRPKSRSSVLEPSQNFLSSKLIFKSLRSLNHVEDERSESTRVIGFVVRARSKEEAICRRGPHKLWLKRATIGLLSYFRRFDRTLREWLLIIFSLYYVVTQMLLYNDNIIFRNFFSKVQLNP
ncbi:protein artichoke [Vespula maculifrons]|uniref:Protein artichoke n=1 Tax=Vespula maculifrons TaxID=7453 RepID=A0ABD2BAV9_VESMC